MFVARGTIHLDGTIDVSGAGGTGGVQAKGGGGGGGSGGMIVLYGTVAATTNAILFANGGGGGGGAGQGTDGNPGADATLYNMAARGRDAQRRWLHARRQRRLRHDRADEACGQHDRRRRRRRQRRRDPPARRGAAREREGLAAR